MSISPAWSSGRSASTSPTTVRSVTSGESCSSCLPLKAIRTAPPSARCRCGCARRRPWRWRRSRAWRPRRRSACAWPSVQHLPGSCEADSAAGFLEQGNAAVFLEPPHAAREGWLRTMQPRRRAAHMLQLGKGLEVAEVAQVHSKSYFDGSPETMDWTVMVPAPILNAEGRPGDMDPGTKPSLKPTETTCSLPDDSF